jgi:uncharacterized phage protein (TIGR01671 family)
MSKFRVYDKQEKKYVSNDNIVLKTDGLLYRVIVRGVIEFLELDPDRYVVEFSTGLKDKNGVEIYENDVVVNRELEVASIQWASKDLAFYFCSITSDEFIGFDEINVEEIEITGNIHGDENDKI